MRVKEGSSDYRYFPEPDVPRFSIDDEWIEKVRASCQKCQPHVVPVISVN